MAKRKKVKRQKRQNNRPQYLVNRKNILAVAIAGVIANQQSGHAANGVLEEVIVTATKQMENQQDVPQAITALTTDDLDRQNISGINDYAKLIPSLAFARREPGGTSVIFRGVAASGIQYFTKASSSVYLDEQSVTTAGLNPNPRIIDIERLEALSGPQGTLFGDASQSGALRIITNKPDTSHFSAWIEGSVNSVEQGEEGTDLSVMVNIPIVENKLALRLVGFTTEEAGYIDNVLGNSQGAAFDNTVQVKEDVNSGTNSGFRAALQWNVSDSWVIDSSAIFQSTESDGFSDTNLDLDELEQVRFNEESFDDEWYQLGLTAEGDLGFAEATLAISYFDRDFEYVADATDYQFDFQQAYPSYDVYDFGGDPNGRGYAHEEDTRITLEGRLAFEDENESRWNAVVGFFYNDLDVDDWYNSFVDGFSQSRAGYYINFWDSLTDVPTGSWGSAVDSDNWYYSIRNRKIKDKAIFGEYKYEITDDLSLTLGGRWYENDTESSTKQGAFQTGSISSEPDLNKDLLWNDVKGEGSESGVVPRLNLTYDFNEDVLTYVTYSEGFRAGGSNPLKSGSVLPQEFDSDILKNFELGFKSTWMDSSLRLNVVIYHMLWEDIQVQVEDPSPVFALGTINFPEAEIDGFEIDLAWAATTNLQVTANYTQTSAEISKSATLYAMTDEPDAELLLIARAESGTDLPITPERKANIALNYVFDTSFMDATPYLRFDFSHMGKSVNGLEGLEATVETAAPTVQRAYTTSDLIVGLDHKGWSASFFIQNLSDKRGEGFYSNRWGSKQRLSLIKPRTIGVSFRKNFR